MGHVRLRLVIFSTLILAAASAFAQSGNQVAKGPTSKTPVPSASKSTSTTIVDVNTASKKTLMGLPGMTDANAQKIIENRPYHSKTELTEKKVLTHDFYDKIAALIVAKTTVRVSPGNVEKKAASSKGSSEVQRQI